MRELKIKNLGLKLKRLLSLALLGVFLLGSTALAQEGETGDETLYEPVEKQIIQLTDEAELEGWKVSRLETYGLKFLIRGKEALTWSLNISDGGFHNPAIEKTYVKVLTIVNSLFILGLLAIAAMWMFSVLVPRKTLKKVLLVYSLAVIFVNFALPVNQLFIDGTSLLQRTLLAGDEGNIQITDIVQTPSYSEAISYQSLEQLEEANPIASGQISEETTNEEGETIQANIQNITLESANGYNLNQEQTVFRFAMILLTAVAYFVIALVFVLRIVILWALLILSPILLVLAIFKSTRGWFYNWLGMYSRWLLIGPLTALGIAVIVNIWQLSGLPIEVAEGYTPAAFTAENSSNIAFYLPGNDTVNTLANTEEMMEYIIFLLMLYLPIILAFALTRQKHLQAAGSYVYRSINKAGDAQSPNNVTVNPMMWEKGPEERRDGIINNVKTLINEKVVRIAGKAMPLNKLEANPEHPVKMMESASNFLKENLSSTPVPKMLELIGMEKGSKDSRHHTIEKLARLERISDLKERNQVKQVLESIAERSESGSHEAQVIIQEVQQMASRDSSDAALSMQIIQSANPSMDASKQVQINVNDQGRENDRKADERSFHQHKKHKKRHKKRKKNADQQENKKQADEPKETIEKETPKPTQNDSN